MRNERNTRIEEELAQQAATFLNRESNRRSLITVTRATISKDGSGAEILVSVFPEAQEEVAIYFLKRIRSSFRDYLKHSARLGRIPIIDFRLDYGEKNREHIEKLSKES